MFLPKLRFPKQRRKTADCTKLTSKERKKQVLVVKLKERWMRQQQDSYRSIKINQFLMRHISDGFCLRLKTILNGYELFVSVKSEAFIHILFKSWGCKRCGTSESFIRAVRLVNRYESYSMKIRKHFKIDDISLKLQLVVIYQFWFLLRIHFSWHIRFGNSSLRGFWGRIQRIVENTCSKRFKQKIQYEMMSSILVERSINKPSRSICSFIHSSHASF